VVIEFFEKDLRPVVEEVNASVVEGGQDPRPVLVEGQALDPLALCFKFCLHHL